MASIVNYKIFTLLALREGAAGAQTEEGRKAFQDAFDKRLELIGGMLLGEPRPEGMFVRPDELRRCGLTPADALGRRGFVFTDELRVRLWNLYHLAKTALVDDPAKRRSPHAWALWASGEFHKEHPACTSTRAYKELTR